MKCPNCRSERLRRSHHRPQDGLRRSVFYAAYRCRDCRQRFVKLALAPILGLVVAALFVLTLALGFALSAIRDSTLPIAEPLASSAVAQQTPEREAERAPTAPVLPAGPGLALAADADAGDAGAQFRLGMAYLNGQGVERDLPAARKWIEKAAEQDYADAQHALGAMYHGGRGVLQNFPLAFKWYERAAQHNHAEAQYSLGMMYRSGQGVPVDKPKSYIWFNLAAAQGHERAREARDNLLPALTTDQVLAAQRAAQEWRPVQAKR